MGSKCDPTITMGGFPRVELWWDVKWEMKFGKCFMAISHCTDQTSLQRCLFSTGNYSVRRWIFCLLSLFLEKPQVKQSDVVLYNPTQHKSPKPTEFLCWGPKNVGEQFGKALVTAIPRIWGEQLQQGNVT